ncbi:FAD:protein FMN transferase [Pontibacter harenae]|uniref:FAD:protein FMN transferase n=1 Tax=Pontibacter harenae TaxID=2894083 RepID=UPI001E4E1D03|nr:FAD:protein FMN transferase [Pontibacter harenae]MCC9167733.1 FAD:protein FMN transferase [Pontibacter harenae]
MAQTRKLFHCHFKIKLPVCFGESLIDQCFELLEKIDTNYNSYQPGSYFDNINRQAGNWVRVDDQCIRMLQTLRLVSELTQGSYDITCMPLIRLWGFYSQVNEDVPTLSELQKTLVKVNYRSVFINGNDVRINPGQEIITGSFIKAFAVDKVVEFLKAQGVTDAIINAGGSTIMALNDEVHPHWNINIPDAFVHGQYPSRITISNQCFSLSGRLNNHLVIKDKTYGHILNSRTGFPVSTVQVGVLTQNAFLGDVLSTALFTVDKNEAVHTIKKMKQHFDFNYFRIEEDGNKISDTCF